MDLIHNLLLCCCRYLTAQIKQQLAKDIILAFPKLRSELTTDGYVGIILLKLFMV